MITTILSAIFIIALFPVGYILGQRSANDAIQRERDLIVDLQAQNDCLQTRMLEMLEEMISTKPDGGKK